VGSILAMEAYYKPKTPGSFGGVDGLHRVLKGRVSKRRIREWLSGQNTYTLHKPVRRKFERNVTFVSNINEQFQADLVDMSKYKFHNNHYTFLLTCIDIFSKYAWAIPMKNKTGKATREALEKIFADRKPKRLQTDRGKEFENSDVSKFLKEQGVPLFFAYNSEIKCSLVERFNRTIKAKLWRYMTFKNTKRYIDVLDDLVHSYNHSRHRSIKMAPANVNDENVKQVWHNLYGHTLNDKDKSPVFKYELGDFVRLSNKRVTFKKGYEKGWSEEIFVVSKQSPREPPVYKIKDLNGEELRGSYYSQELQKVQAPQLFEIEKVVKTKGKGENFTLLVKWFDYPDRNHWVTLKDIVII
jgi:transposase InsO family protein